VTIAMAAPSRSRAASVSLVDPLTQPEWDRRGGKLAPSFFHTQAWARVLVDTYGFRPQYFISGDASAPTALPMMEIDSWLTGRRGICLPFTDECAPGALDAAAFEPVLSAALEHAKRRRWAYLEIRGGRPLLGPIPAAAAYWGHTLSLEPSTNAQFTRVADSHRRAVRKAERSGLTVEFSTSPAATRAFYALLCRTRRRHGLPPQPWEFFANIQKYILAAGAGHVALAKNGVIPIAGAIFFHCGSEVLFKFGASDERWQHLRGNNLVMWRAIQRYGEEGCRQLDFGRTSRENTGLRQFKLAWGAREREVEYFRYRPMEGGFSSAPDRAAGWYNHVFRHLPMPLSKLAGSFLYKHIA
jgi:hypothetical protein